MRSLPRFGEELSNLPEETEAEILSIGSSLQLYHEKATKISSLSSTAASHLAGDELERAMETVGSLLKQMGSYIDESQSGTQQRMEKFKSMLETVKRIQTQMEEFAQLSKSLRILGVTTKIYAPGGAGEERDSVLAGNISMLSGKISSKVAQAAGDLKAVAESINDALGRIRGIKDARYRQMRDSLSQMSAGLKALKERHDSSRGVFSEIATLSKAVSMDIERVVMSAQYQDITRQKFQTARQALGCLCEIVIEAYEEVGGVSEGEDNIHETTLVVCERVAINLLDARGAFIDAVENIIDSLNDVSIVISILSGHMHSMAGSAESVGQTYLQEIGDNLASVKSALTGVFDAETEMANAIAEAGNAVIKTKMLIREIEEIGDNVDIIAMNAAVRSAQSNGKGSAMGVLAGAIRKVSEESISTTGETTVALKMLSDEISDLLAAVNDEFKANMQTVNHMEEEMGPLVASLGSLNTSVVSSIREMDGEVHQLSESIANIVDNTNSHHCVDKVVGTVVSGLTSMAIAWGRPLLLRDFVEAGRPVFTDSQSDQEPVELAGRDYIISGNGAGAEFGNNIELFE